MRKIDNYENVQENAGGEFEKLPAGGYICKIKSATDVPEKEYLKIEFDIIEGKYRGWYTEIYKRTGSWYGNFVRSYKESAAGFFKGFITAVSQSNPGFVWDWSEKTLTNKNVGLVLAYEEYENKHEEIKERVYMAQNRSVDAIRTGDFTVPSLKKLSASKPKPAPRLSDYEADMQEISDDLPFA